MVKADDDSEYLQINDFYTYNAYKWWQLYGLSADTSTSYTNTLNSISQATETGTFTFSGNFSGSFDASVSLTYTGTIKTGSEGNTFWSSTSESGLMYDDSFHGIEMTITPSANGATNDYNATYACVYNTQSTSTAATMTCTPNYSTNSQPLTLPEQTITIDEIRFNSAGSIQTDLFLSLLNQGSEVGSLNGSLGMSGGGTGSLSLTENGTTTTTTVNTNSLGYVLPMMTGNISNYWPKNTYVNIPENDPYRDKFFFNSVTDPYTLIFLTPNRVTAQSSHQFVEVKGAFRTNWDTKYTRVSNNNFPARSELNSGLSLNIIYLATNDYVTKENAGGDSLLRAEFYLNNFQGLIPLYAGYLKYLPDDLYRYCFGTDRTIQAIDAQTAADQQHHDEMMDTSDSAQISTDGNELVEDADEKFGDLFFPLQHAVDTAHDLANVNATGVIRLPAIFKDDYWYLDLTVIERNLPQAWTFIQSLCQLAVAIYMIKGLYNLFFGGGKEDDS